MPYKIIEAPGGFYVKSEGGTLLSKKPLTESRAKKQLTAANLSYLRSEERIPPRADAARHKGLIGLMKDKMNGK
jgi:hypothetical protein